MTKPKVYLIHGFNLTDWGAETTDKLRTYFEASGYDVCELDYGFLFLLGVRFRNKKIAAKFADQAEPGSVLVGHSNGCALISLMAEKGLPISRAVMIQPALNKNWKPPNNVKGMAVYYNRRDRATWLAKFLVLHRWGAMGTYGPDYDDPRLSCIDVGRLGYFGHSVEFEHIEFWGPRIVADVNVHLEESA